MGLGLRPGDCGSSVWAGGARDVCLAVSEVAEPILDLGLLRTPIVWAPTLVSACIGALLTGLTAFAPNYLERTTGVTPIVAGFAVAALTLGWPISAATAGRLYLRWGFRRTALIGSCVALCGALALVSVGMWPDPVRIALAAFVIGFGLGWTATPTLIAAQSAVDWDQRGSVTGLNVFARTAGGAIGVAVYGAVSNSIIASGGGEFDAPTVTLATEWVFVGVVITAILLFSTAWAMPRPQTRSHT